MRLKGDSRSGMFYSGSIEMLVKHIVIGYYHRPVLEYIIFFGYNVAGNGGRECTPKGYGNRNRKKTKNWPYVSHPAVMPDKR